MHAEQQSIRQSLMNVLRAESDKTEEGDLFTLAAELRKHIKQHAARLRTIVSAHGWPSVSRVGQKISAAAFDLVQHAEHDAELQYTVLDLIEEESERESDAFLNQQRALLTDTIRASEDRPQVYGMKIMVENGEMVTPLVEDPDQLDVRRAEVGLPPYEEYLNELRSEVDFSAFRM